MQPYSSIETFLRRVKQIRSGNLALKGIYCLLAVAGGIYLTGNLLSYFNVPYLPILKLPLSILFLALLGYAAYRYLFKGPYGSFSLDDAALLTESRHPHLNNSLINASQLLRQLSDPEREGQVSFSLIQEQLHRTQGLVEKIDPASVGDDTVSVPGRNAFLGTAAVLLVSFLFLPDFFSQGYQNWIAPPAPQTSAPVTAEIAPKAAQEKAVPPAVRDLRLTYHFPAYSGKKSKVIDPADGSVFVLPGTEVHVEATAVPEAPAAAELVLNGGDGFTMQVGDAGRLRSQVLIKEKGFYQFKLKDAEGKRHLLPKKYAIALEKDQAPSVTLFIANPSRCITPTPKWNFSTRCRTITASRISSWWRSSTAMRSRFR